MSHRKYKSNKSNKGRLLPFIKLHRWLGLFSLLFIILLSSTGILLNHTEELSLDEQSVQSHWLQSLYGIKMPKQQNYQKLDNTWVVQLGQQIYYNQLALTDESSSLIFAYQTAEFSVLIFQEAVYLVTFEGELIERLDHNNGLPTPISNVLAMENEKEENKKKESKKSYLIYADQKWYSNDENYMTWSINEHVKKSVNLVRLNKPEQAIQAIYRNLYLGNSLTLERVILDMHSGRLLGMIGVYFMDVVALILIILALSGLWIWSCRLRKRIK